MDGTASEYVNSELVGVRLRPERPPQFGCPPSLTFGGMEMRVLLVLLALVVTPFVAGVAQGKAKKHEAEHCAKRLAKLARKDKKIKEKDIANCVEPPPPPLPPPAACEPSAPGTGTASVSGGVYLDADPWNALSSWCIKLIGPGGTATAITDINGEYIFTGVPAGTYTVCETITSGWMESFPTAGFGGACPTGYGWSVTVAYGDGAEFNNFGNLPTTP